MIGDKNNNNTSKMIHVDYWLVLSCLVPLTYYVFNMLLLLSNCLLVKEQERARNLHLDILFATSTA